MDKQLALTMDSLAGVIGLSTHGEIHIVGPMGDDEIRWIDPDGDDLSCEEAYDLAGEMIMRWQALRARFACPSCGGPPTPSAKEHAGGCSEVNGHYLFEGGVST